MTTTDQDVRSILLTHAAALDGGDWQAFVSALNELATGEQSEHTKATERIAERMNMEVLA